jgi:maltose alpha-D-glucosyltransferase/alpha-amylase
MKQHLEAATLGVGDDGAALVASSDAFFLTMIRQLGLRTAQLHRALCPAAGASPDFAPEPITPQDTASWRAACHARAQHVLTLVRRLGSSHPAFGHETLARFADNAARLPEAIDALFPEEAALGAMKTRFHGDYHLGQVLVVQNDFSIIDFEGEPLRPLAERRAKSSPLRDVAGMLRSFDYLTEASLRQMAQLPASHGPTARSAAMRRRDEAIDAFLGGYLETMAGCPSLPADPDAARRLIRFFALDKALYEIEYELAQRPDWVTIPVAGVLDLIDAAFNKETGTRTAGPRQTGSDHAG